MTSEEAILKNNKIKKMAQEEGLTIIQYVLLNRLYEEKNSMQKYLFAGLPYKRPNLTIAISDMEDMNLITRSPGRGRRSKIVRITPRGEEVIERVNKEIEDEDS